ncbi:MAG: efflux RND transporter periplasmic adaptor subunit [Bacteroidales bacterium]|nr:efflux RND transporter periplasmic adaptor subunit [Bacteroidales bacterium]MBP3254777.1 efflux RND transporter periplasmic adaptor subunit [Bacteroidales bacterium]
MKEFINKYKTVLPLVLIILGIFIGWVIFAPSKNKQSDKKDTATKEYTCSMHPQIRQDKAGKCPLCGMDLTEVGKTSEEHLDPNTVMFTDQAAALANIETMVVWEEDGEKVLTLYGNVEINQRTAQVQPSYVSGRIEKLYINAEGDRVTKGQNIAKIYSPELYTATQELITALSYPDKMQSEILVNAAKEKLLLWNLTESQINNIINTHKATPYIDIKAVTSGIVTEKNVNQGDYISPGKNLFTVADLANVWIVLKAYEKDLAFLHTGQKVTFTCEALAGKQFNGSISFIDPVINNQSRTADVRVVIQNASGMFKPNMYVKANVTADLSQYKGKIIVPNSAVLWSGKKSIVYVKDPEQEQPSFTLRQVELGPSLNGSYIILNGLQEGEEIAIEGVFAIDAAAQLEGKKSLMNGD